MKRIISYPVTECNLCKGSLFEAKYIIEKNPIFKYRLPEEEKIGWKEMKIVRCENCGLVFMNPQLSFKEVSQIYTNEYHKAHREDLKIKIYEERISHIRKYKINGRLLDVGCGYGYFLSSASKYFDVTGLELSKHASNFARDYQNVSVINQDFLRAKIRANFFDVVTFWDIIEHLHEPYLNLLKINKILKKSGIFALRTGDISSLNAIIAGKYWFFYNLCDHQYFFSKDTLTKMLNRAGFEIIEIYKEHSSFQDFIRWLINIITFLNKRLLVYINKYLKMNMINSYLREKPEPVIWVFRDQMTVISKKVKSVETNRYE